jgi:hypothetical protein
LIGFDIAPLQQGTALSIIEQLVLGELAKQNELKAFGERGFHWQRGDDETRLWLQRTKLSFSALLRQG